MRALRAIFVLSIFTSAFLLFLIQPIITKLLLPAFGGTPAVWNTALVFFQGLLLVGYLYAHVLVRRARSRRRLWIHAAVLAAPIVLLPPSLPAVLHPSLSRWPAGVLLAALTLLVGAPFFVLATNSSLVQYWWSRAGFEGGDDPYWLYGASNSGSLLALLGYPFLIEPAISIGTQLTLWSVGYGVFVVLTTTVMLAGSRLAAAPDEAVAAAGGGAPIAPSRVLLWTVRAAVGTSLLLSVSTRISTDVASVPLLWVVPLSIYLITFILAFGLGERLRRPPLVAGAFIGIALSFGLLLAPRVFRPATTGVISLLVLFFGALLCNRDLVADRPAARDLTAFYLWISVGGALGGVLNSLVAPIVFDSVAEFPLTLLALAFLVYASPEDLRRRKLWKPGVALGIACAAALVLPELVAGARAGEIRPGLWSILAVAVVAAGLAVARYPGLIGGLTLVAGALSLSSLNVLPDVIAQERSFFGVSRVLRTDTEIQMLHGTTIHGTQSRDPVLQRKPSSYYHPEGPIGSVVLGLDSTAVIGVVGLGAGAMSALASAGQTVLFYEIDATVVALARRYFTYLRDAHGDVRVVLGDGRLALADAPDASHDLLVVDAFSSDFVPTHLLTNEAFSLYLSKVKPDGIVLLHISNRYVDLRRIVRGFSDASGAPVAVADYVPAERAEQEGAFRTQVAALANDSARARDLLDTALWTPIPDDVPAVQWTDQQTDLFRVLR